MSGQTGIAVRPRRTFADGRVSPHEACGIAARCVRCAGFVHVWTSMSSEACYYAFPGRHGTLRIATHSKGGKNPNMKDGPTVVSITFPEVNSRGFSHEHVENYAANDIGLYLIRSATKD